MAPKHDYDMKTDCIRSLPPGHTTMIASQEVVVVERPKQRKTQRRAAPSLAGKCKSITPSAGTSFGGGRGAGEGRGGGA